MARRKSPWQQFADNFDSTYSTMNTMFSDFDEMKIMGDEVTEMYDNEKGIGPHGPNQGDKYWQYAGKRYDKEITPEMLSGLRNTRLIDNMAKWGDTKGAMELRQAQATIDASTAATAAQVQQNELFAQTFADQKKAYGLQNDLTSSQIGLTDANKERILATYPVEARKLRAEAMGLEWDNKYAEKVFDFKVDEQEAKTSTAMTQAEKVALELEEFEKTSHLRTKSVKSGYLQVIDDNKVKKLENRVAIDVAKQKIAVNDVMKTFRDMAKRNEFVDDQAAQDWLVDNIGNVDPDLALDMRDNYNQHQIAAITQKSTMFKTAAMEAYTSGGVEGLSTAIDNLNGVNDTFVEYNDKNKNKVTIWAIDPKTKKRLNPIVSGTLGEGGDFDMNLQKALDPASSMAISKAYHDDLLVQADIEYKKALEEKAKQEGIAAKNAKSEFKKDDFLIRLLMKDPNNQMAWNGLLGENMTSDQIKEELRLEHLRQDNDNPQIDRGEKVIVDGEVDRDGLIKNKDDVATPKYESVAGTTGFTKTQIDPSASENDQKKQKYAAGKEINDRVWKVWDVIKDDIIPWTRDSNLNAADLAEQKLRDAAKTWLRKNWTYFKAHPDHLEAFEENPEQWVKEHTGIGSGG